MWTPPGVAEPVKTVLRVQQAREEGFAAGCRDVFLVIMQNQFDLGFSFPTSPLAHENQLSIALPLTPLSFLVLPPTPCPLCLLGTVQVALWLVTVGRSHNFPDPQVPPSPVKDGAHKASFAESPKDSVRSGV